MKKLGVYLLLLIVSLQATPLQQLIKVPVLIEHYAEHRNRDQNIDFFAFLAMHYLGHEKNDGDEERDMELPFRKANLQHVIYLIYQQTNTSPDPKPFIVWASSIAYPVLQDKHCPDSFKGSLFKPPRA